MRRPNISNDKICQKFLYKTADLLGQVRINWPSGCLAIVTEHQDAQQGCSWTVSESEHDTDKCLQFNLVSETNQSK